MRRWAHGCYTLVHDTDPEGAEFALDALLYLGGSGKEHKVENIERFYPLGHQPCNFGGTKKKCLHKKRVELDLNSHIIDLVHQHDLRFIFLEHQYGRHDVM